MSRKDKIYKKTNQRSSDFVFDKKVAGVFDDMLSRSVPFYEEIQNSVVELAARFAQGNTAVYDLGCSTGNTLYRLAKAIHDPNVKIVGMDNSPAMLREARNKMKKLHLAHRILFVGGDLNRKFSLRKASVVIMNWTMQFVRPLNRDNVVGKIYDALRPGGCFLLMEKVLGRNSLLNRLYIDLYYDFKRRMGYSKLEIAQKREALENVLIPYQPDENIELFKRNGFETADIFFRWYNWAGFIGVKQPAASDRKRKRG